MLNKKGNRLIKLKPYLCAIAVSFLGYGIFPLYLVSQKLQEINSFIVAFDLLDFKMNGIQIMYIFSIPLEKFSACPFVVIAAVTEEERKQRPTKRKKVTTDTNRGMLQVAVALIPMWRLQGTMEMGYMVYIFALGLLFALPFVFLYTVKWKSLYPRSAVRHH